LVMHNILDNFFDDNSFFSSMIEKDNMGHFISCAFYEKNNFYL